MTNERKHQIDLGMRRYYFWQDMRDLALLLILAASTATALVAIAMH